LRKSWPPRRQKEQDKNREKLLELKTQLKALKDKLNATQSEELRTILLKETASLEKIMKKVPRTKRHWSPILPSSFEGDKK